MAIIRAKPRVRTLDLTKLGQEKSGGLLGGGGELEKTFMTIILQKIMAGGLGGPGGQQAKQQPKSLRDFGAMIEGRKEGLSEI